MADTASKFVVLTTNRSGSEWVMSTLNSFQGVFTQGELFLPKARGSEKKWDSDFAYPRYVEARFRRESVRPFSVFAYLDDLYSLPGKVGFKLMYKQLGLNPEILLYFIKHRVRVVHLVRKNHLDVMLSYAVKARIGRAHLMVGQKTPDEIHVQLETKNLVGKLAWLEKQQNIARVLLKWCKLPNLDVAYEDLVRDRTQFHRVADFLLINSRDQMPQSALARIRKGGHRDVIGNYDEVKKVLANSRFASLLE